MSLSAARRAILQHAVAGEGANNIAQHTGIATATVRGVLAQHGGDRAGWQAALGIDGDAEPVHPADIDPYEVEVASKPDYRAPGRVVVQPPQPDSRPGSILALLKRAEQGDAKSKRLAGRIHDDLMALRDHVEAIEAKAAAKQAEVEARAAAVAEVERLTAELAAAKERAAAPKVRTTRAARRDTAAIRVWAVEQGLTVAPVGKMPAHVVDAYKEAHSNG